MSHCEPAFISSRSRRRALAILIVALALSSQVRGDPGGLLHREISVASSRRAPLTFVGFEYLQKFDPSTPRGLSRDVFDLYAGLAQTPKGRWEPGIREAWLRLSDPTADAEVRMGRLSPAYGLTPALELRSTPLLPLFDLDLRVLREWGLATRAYARGFVYEGAATWSLAGTGRRPARRPLFSGRVGVPSFRDVRYGVSGLFGTVSVPDDSRVNGWRLAADAVYHYHEPFTALMGEASFGADSHHPVWGFLVRLSQILPHSPHWQLVAQVRRWHSSTVATDTETTVGVSRSLPYLMTLRGLWLHRSAEGGSLIVQLHYYAP